MRIEARQGDAKMLGVFGYLYSWKPLTLIKCRALYLSRAFVAAGGLLSYGPDRTDLYRRAAGYVDRILKGEKPANMPVQAPTKYQLVINLKTAKALGLEVPLHLQQLADELIE
jgi:putative ABC transport system substrate-binding protein